jgi:hypothetical protein
MSDKYSAILRTANEDIDITENLAQMYDLIVNSMDWGSNFLDESEYRMIVEIGMRCGFKIPECGKIGRVLDESSWSHGYVGYVECDSGKAHTGKHSGMFRKPNKDGDTFLGRIEWDEYEIPWEDFKAWKDSLNDSQAT